MIEVIDNYKVVDKVSYEDYFEIEQAQLSSRVLNGSQDHGWDIEYVGEGIIKLNEKNVKVKAIYLFEKEEYNKIMEERDGDEGCLGWEDALKRFEITD
jgi:hypothetical protein